MEIPFHSGTHLQLWYSTPLRSLNPHLFLILLVSILSIIGLLIYQSRKKRAVEEDWADEYSQAVEDYQLEKQRKDKLLKNLANLKQRLEQGEIDTETFGRLEETYKRRLKLVYHKLRKLEVAMEVGEEEEEI